MNAAYVSRCAECADLIRKGDPIRMTPEGARHDECPEGRESSGLVLRREPCPRCFMEPAVSGECGCAS